MQPVCRVGLDCPLVALVISMRIGLKADAAKGTGWKTTSRGTGKDTTDASPKTFLPSAAKLRILLIWVFRGPGFRSARQVLCGDAACLFLDHLAKPGADRAMSQGPESRAPKTL